jgi:hypothetical protein
MIVTRLTSLALTAAIASAAVMKRQTAPDADAHSITLALGVKVRDYTPEISEYVRDPYLLRLIACSVKLRAKNTTRTNEQITPLVNNLITELQTTTAALRALTGLPKLDEDLTVHESNIVIVS